MPRDTEAIERDIENARNQLAQTLDVLAVRTNPKRLVESTKQGVLAKLNEPAVRAALIGAGAIVGLLVVRKLFR
ncbi:DUF3618 domain-containing protein [Rhodococcus sp. SGAir0479]|uniref:DUF3618 domain-containing protein n=1 Tax=Rhodococcus sp. SGAir0479 TaxID=2567884 RepID=UPI0010CD6AC1|nr:DUF3618 domain-containing protein [Rhodococcus sp. SGAir0479]QCQ91787.1 DUF3618 domain-containing protein [Rhodococcus sp. SGAir0479]